jgi:enoyl-CoA hydratase/carnithine racemase
MSAVQPAQLLAEVRNHVGHLILNRPAALNVLSLSMVREMQTQLQRWAEDPDINAVVVRGAGEKAFCAGGDIRALHEAYRSGNPEWLQFFTEEYALDLYIHQYSKPYVALLDGYVMGGGMGISQGGALRIVTERTRMAMPEVVIGFFPDAGGSYFLSRLPGALGIYLGVTGRQIGAADAIHCGLADYMLPSTRMTEFIGRLDDLAWDGDPLARIKTLTASMQETPTPPELPLVGLRDAVDRHFSVPTVTAIQSSLSSETDSRLAGWAQDTLKSMARSSPLAMCTTLEALRRARDLPVEACLHMELGMVEKWMVRGDIMEGIRALIIDKDNQPRWNPPALNEVTPERLAEFFTHMDASSRPWPHV